DPKEVADELETLLKDAVGLCMVSDVPLGAFLSGGTDSSLVVAMMQAQSARPVRTFSIGFEEAAFDESKHAALVARHLGTQHTEMTVTHRDALGVIPNLAQIYDEPFADSSQIPTYLLSKLTRRHVTVSLSGDGGDEVFGGYNRYLWGRQLARLINCVPHSLRRLGCRALCAMPVAAWDSVAGGLSSLLPGRLKVTHPGDKLHKLAGVAGAADAPAAYLGLTSLWDVPGALTGLEEPDSAVLGAFGTLDHSDVVPGMMAADAVTYLPDDILVKVDRASMAVSLESRIPLLDHRIFEFAWRLPTDMKVRGGIGKQLLRQVLYRYVPQSLIERPKMGFGVPIGEWMLGPLRDWAEDLLSTERLRAHGLLEPGLVRQKWSEHLQGRRNWQHQLWTVLMLQAWMEKREAEALSTGLPE
ncbi:MAG: asparagine synthase C-terminal domain-containing protein, partial [Rhodospirillales bacterium]|nr:asparagine synthase C-terminal domain-containing protein [Rhodospirillales bacterium]